MIFCNLSQILNDKEISISQLARETGVSRISLAALANNKSTGINYETLNLICNYLRITPNSFFLYLPFEIVINDTSFTNSVLEVKVTIEYYEYEDDDYFSDFVLHFKSKDNNTFIPLDEESNKNFFNCIDEGNLVVSLVHKYLINTINDLLSLDIKTLNLDLIPVISII